jgi:hypothetical protein
MVFEADSDGPFWRTKAQRESTRLDRFTGEKKTKKNTRLQLIEKLVHDGKGIPQGRISYGSAKEICEARGIPTTYEEDTVIEDWVDKPKGQKQVLWERELIDVTKLSSYSKDGPKDEEGHRDTTYSLEVLMESCLDFLLEKTSLQKLGEDLGVMIEHTPKYHAELAGEGVEYD